MAGPQIEDGYTRIANEILEYVMKTSLNGTQFRLVIAAWRYTYGFRRKEHELSLGFLAGQIGASRSQVDRELSVLIERRIFKVEGAGKRGARIIRFNKNFVEWEAQNKPAPPKTKKGSVEMEKQPKKTRQPKQYTEDNTYYKMAVYFHDKVKAVAEAEGLSHLIVRSDLQKWADEFRKLVAIDKVQDKHLIRDVIDWVTSDPFWKVNVLSAKKLRDKFGELALKMKAAQKPKQQQKQKADPRDKEIAFQRWIQEGNNPDEFDWN